MEKQSLREKPTLQDIRRNTKTRTGQPITLQDITALAGLTLAEVYSIDIGGYSSEKNRQTVLRVFNTLTGQKLTSNDIRHGEVTL